MSGVFLGALAALFGLLGADLAAHAVDIGMYTFGFGLMAFGIFYPVWLVKMHFDGLERARPLSPPRESERPAGDADRASPSPVR